MNLLKKIGLMASAVFLSTGLYAGTVEKHVGANYVTLDSTSGYGINYGMTLFGSPIDSAQNIIIGAGFDINFNSLGEDMLGSSFTYGMDGKLITGYKFTNRFNAKIGIGYDWEMITGSAYYSGMIYTASAMYAFSERYGVELEYRGGDMTISTAAGDSDSFNTGNVALNFVWRY